jgi:hypothetical protein
VKKYVFAVLALTLPAFGTITAVQSDANWSCTSLSGSSVTCMVNTTTHTTGGHLLAVWTFWQPGSFPYTAAVHDSLTSNSFVSAVGPTVQSAGSTLTSAQIFYAANITGSGVGADTITVTFSCPYPANPSCASSGISQAGVVAVEYSGADINNPLDSVSVGYSPAGNTTALLDSGNVAPANSNLLVFGAGFADQNVTLVAGTGFTRLQHSNNTWGTGGVEDNSAAITGNNVLQRATACIGTCAGDKRIWRHLLDVGDFLHHYAGDRLLEPGLHRHRAIDDPDRRRRGLHRQRHYCNHHSHQQQHPDVGGAGVWEPKLIWPS